MTQLTSFQRGLAVMRVVAEHGEATAELIADELDLPLSSLYRYLGVLKESGYLTEQDSRYLPGRALLDLAGRHVTQSHLADVGVPMLRHVVEALGETAVMIVRVGRKAVCLRRVEPDKSIKYSFALGQLLPLHAGAGQRILLAWAPGRLLADVLNGELPRYTPDTLGREQLVASLPRIRESGWVVSRGELDPGSLSVAVPVFLSGDVVCSLNVAGPASRCDSREWIRNAVAVLQDAATDLSDSLEAWAHVPPGSLSTPPSSPPNGDQP